MARSSVDKTRAWDNIKVASLKVNKHARAYRRARRALEHLGADNATLAHFQELQIKHLKISADITEENRVDQRSDTLPWFWRLDGQNADQHDSWMQECKFIYAGKQVFDFQSSLQSKVVKSKGPSRQME